MNFQSIIIVLVSLGFTLAFAMWYMAADAQLRVPTDGFPMTRDQVHNRWRELWLAGALAVLVTLFGITTSNVDLQGWVIALQLGGGMALFVSRCR
jgi:hypothetical protein